MNNRETPEKQVFTCQRNILRAIALRLLTRLFGNFILVTAIVAVGTVLLGQVISAYDGRLNLRSLDLISLSERIAIVSAAITAWRFCRDRGLENCFINGLSPTSLSLLFAVPAFLAPGIVYTIVNRLGTPLDPLSLECVARMSIAYGLLVWLSYYFVVGNQTHGWLTALTFFLCVLSYFPQATLESPLAKNATYLAISFAWVFLITLTLLNANSIAKLQRLSSLNSQQIPFNFLSDLSSSLKEGAVVQRRQRSTIKSLLPAQELREVDSPQEGQPLPIAQSAINHVIAEQKMKPKLVFISYAREDSAFKRRLVTTMATFKDLKSASWDDSNIQSGRPWLNEIKQAIADSRQAICLVSTDFLASEFIRDVELPLLLEAQENKQLVIHWVHTKPCNFRGIEFFANTNAIISPDRPLANMPESDLDGALVAICDVLESHLGRADGSSATS